MTTLLIYESMFGNTKAIAGAIRDGMSAAGIEARFLEVGDAPPILAEDVRLVIAGGPTHAFGLSRASTRADAARQATGPLVSSGAGLREWIEAVEAATPPQFATFDTKVRRPRLPGSAARSAAKQLRHRGWKELVPPKTFFVDGTAGPLLDGEVERAVRWGRGLAAMVTTTARVE